MKQLRKLTLSECCDIVSGATPRTTNGSYWNGDICWTTPKDLSDLDSHYISDTPRKITASGLANCGAFVLPANSVLFSSRAPIGHVAINTVPMATNQGFKSFVPHRDTIEPKFLFHWLRKNRNYLESLGNGATFKEVSKATVSRIEISIPPLPEQRRIAAILDQADALRAKRREALAQLDSLTQSIFIEMFGDPVANPKGMRKAPISNVADLSTGSTPGRGTDGFYGGSIPWVKTTEVAGSDICDTEEKLTAAGLRAIGGKLHPVNSILVAMYGQGQTRGRCALLAIEASCNQACGVIRPNKSFLPRFMFVQLSLAYERLRALGRGGNQENLNLQLLGSFEVLLPPLPLQQIFATRIQAIESLKATHSAALAELDNLFASLQHRAFRGEL